MASQYLPKIPSFQQPMSQLYRIHCLEAFCVLVMVLMPIKKE